MRILPTLLLAILSGLPAHASVRTWRAEGTVTNVTGEASLLPLPVAPGDAFSIDFSFDTEVEDASVDPTVGVYPLAAASLTIAGVTLPFVDGEDGGGNVQILTDPHDPNRWSMAACLGGCANPLMDQIRLNMAFPPGTFGSDALVDPPDPAGATSIQFGQFSRDTPAPEEAFVQAELVSLPEPAAALSLAAGLAVLGTARARQLRRR